MSRRLLTRELRTDFHLLLLSYFLSCWLLLSLCFLPRLFLSHEDHRCVAADQIAHFSFARVHDLNDNPAINAPILVTLFRQDFASRILIVSSHLPVYINCSSFENSLSGLLSPYPRHCSENLVQLTEVHNPLYTFCISCHTGIHRKRVSRCFFIRFSGNLLTDLSTLTSA